MGIEYSKENQEVKKQGSIISPHSFGVRTDPIDVAVNSGHPIDATVEPPVQMDTEPSSYTAIKVRRSLRRRSGVHYGMFVDSSEGESDCEQPIQVSQRWHPEDPCRPIIDEAPTFHPSEEEFKDTLAYIAKIRQKAEPYGICRIIPPPSWKPPCPLKEKGIWDCAKFTTRIQQINKLQNRDPVKKKTRNRVRRRRKRRRHFRFGMTRRRAGSDAFENDCAGSDTDEKFGFQSGSDFNLRTFQKFADHFKELYFVMEDGERNNNSASEESQKRWEPSIEEIEGEYWRIVEKSTEEIEVHYGADIETGNFGSGFLKANQRSEGEPDPHALSGWNLNNFPRLSGSVLSFERSDISGVLVPWLYIGMCFSSFCWHVEDHHLYSLNYMHFGDPKVWYGVAGSDAAKLEEAMKKHLPELFEEQPHLLNELVTQLSPSVLKSEGVPVYRAVQSAGEFLLTFPRAYHAGFNCGFNCAEAVNVAPINWLCHGQCAVELYSEQCRKTSLSHDKLLLGAALEAVKSLRNLSPFMSTTSEISLWKDFCGENGVLTKAVKERIAMEKKRREILPIQIQSRRINENFDSDERECISCFYDLYLSAIGCVCSPNQFTCLNHMKMLCSCEPRRRFLLFRYDMDELDTLLAALEGDANAIKKWVFNSRSVPILTQSLNSDDFRPTLLFDSEDCSKESNCRPFELKVDTIVDIKFPTCSFHNQINELDCHEENETLPIKESLKCEGEGISEMDKSNYLENNERKADKSFGPTLPTKFDASDSINFVHDVGKGHETTFFYLNSDEACIKNEEVSRERIDGEKEEQSALISLVDMSFIKEKVQNFNSLEKASSHSKIMKTDVSRADKIPTDDLMWGSDHVTTQGPEKDLVLSPIHVADLAASKIFHIRNSDSVLCSESAEHCSKPRGSMLFGFDLLLQRWNQSLFDGQTIQKGGFASLSSDHCATETDRNQSVDSMQSIELLDLGTVVSGKMWCSHEAIFPKGFRSRIKFISVLNPCQTCNYISEVLSGVLGPLFKVTMEEFPDVNFMSTSPTLCWELVRRTLEEKLTGFHVEGLCPYSIQTIGSINGLEMFGFLFQPIVQAIEALDPYHCCTEYWAAKADKRLKQRIAACLPVGSMEESNGEIRTNDDDHQLDGLSNAMPRELFGADLPQKEMSYLEPLVDKEVNQVLGGLIMNASPLELDMLQDIFCTLPLNNKRVAAFGKLLMEAKKRRCSSKEVDYHF